MLSSLSATEIVGAVFPRLLRELSGWQLMCLQAACGTEACKETAPKHKLTASVQLLSQIVEQCKEEILSTVYCKPLQLTENGSIPTENSDSLQVFVLSDLLWGSYLQSNKISVAIACDLFDIV